MKGNHSVRVSAGNEVRATVRWWSQRARRTALSPLIALIALACLAAVALSGCGAATNSLPGGVYTSQQYHFRVTYPAGWQANTSSQPAATAPLIVIITRSGARQQPGSLLSSLTIDVLNTRDASVAQTATALSKNSALSKITLGGQPGYRDKPVQETSGSVIVTHSDYYLVHNGYLYQISADALAGDGPTPNTMTQSFTILG